VRALVFEAIDLALAIIEKDKRTVKDSKSQRRIGGHFSCQIHWVPFFFPIVLYFVLLFFCNILYESFLCSSISDDSPEYLAPS
jgi:hypothetical protein